MRFGSAVDFMAAQMCLEMTLPVCASVRKPKQGELMGGGRGTLPTGYWLTRWRLWQPCASGRAGRVGLRHMASLWHDCTSFFFPPSQGLTQGTLNPALYSIREGIHTYALQHERVGCQKEMHSCTKRQALAVPWMLS